ncbi:hypothetical protein IU459_12075 [Nocardia amamiensis]|uniref:Excisionase n=1 Tax=Nocardia amamiensis TaxID=404578 RepID=A0ABS0CNV6_9NOCA|nr:hypothetical protein [Nocardia amamiensis]MBF6298279.1 hypothetical protein [Nocardia amamiensis]
MPAETCTHPLAYVVEQTGVPSEDWLRRKLNAGEIPGRRAGRIWRMTDSDIAALVDYLARPARISSADIRLIAETPAASASGLTQRAKRNLQRRQPA